MNLWLEILKATGETLLMVSVSTLGAFLLGLPLGTYLYIVNRIKPNPFIARTLTTLINIMRSIPFIILLVALIPLTRRLIGTSIGTWAAIVPLTVGAIPFFARLTENIYQNLPKGLTEAGLSMGASVFKLIRFILLPEAYPHIIQALTVTAITLINYSAMAGTVGGGGLGDLAIRYGYQRFDTQVMFITVAILVILVQLIQWIGDRLVVRLTH